MVLNMSEAGTLEEQALKRKERLRALKRKKDDPKTTNSLISDELPKPKFRSYQPEAQELKEHTLPDADIPNIEEEIKDQLDAAKTKVVIDELDITNLAPRKPDWDLKRDVAKKLEKLERRTQRAIAELIRDRLKERQQDLAALVYDGTANP